jgi:D-amino-acid dehydrogenase
VHCLRCAWLFRHWLQSTPERKDATARGAKPLVERCIVEHEALAGDAGVLGLMRRTGYLRVYRSAQALDAAFA